MSSERQKERGGSQEGKEIRIQENMCESV